MMVVSESGWGMWLRSQISIILEIFLRNVSDTVLGKDFITGENEIYNRVSARGQL